MAAEKNFENRLKIFLQSIGVYALGTPTQNMKVPPIGYYEKRWGSKMSGSGLPDMHIIVKGYSFEVELKAPKGKASEMQKHMVEQIIKSGCSAAIVYEKIDYIPYDGYEYYATYRQLKDAILKQAGIGEPDAILAQ